MIPIPFVEEYEAFNVKYVQERGFCNSLEGFIVDDDQLVYDNDSDWMFVSLMKKNNHLRQQLPRLFR